MLCANKQYRCGFQGTHNLVTSGHVPMDIYVPGKNSADEIKKCTLLIEKDWLYSQLLKLGDEHVWNLH